MKKLAPVKFRVIRLIEGVERGLVDVNEGRVVPHDDAMAEIYTVIEGTKAKPS